MSEPTTWVKFSDWEKIADAALSADVPAHPHCFVFLAWDSSASNYYNVNITYASILARIVSVMGGYTLAYDNTWTEAQCQAYSAANTGKICFYKE